MTFITCFIILLQVDYSADKNYISNKITFNTRKIKVAVNRTFSRYSDKQFLYSVQNKIKHPDEDANFIQLNRLFYDYIAWEEEIAYNAGFGYTCKHTCEYPKYNGTKMQDGDRCDGYVINCASFSKAIVVEEVTERRLYSGYSDGVKWFGSKEPGSIREMQGFLNGIFYCDVCRCNCENKYGMGVKRWFYSKILSAPDGYVVTGVRFTQKNRVFFIQPQISKLIGIGRVDSNTTHWLDLPQLFWNEKVKEFDDTFTLQYEQDNHFTIGSYNLKPNQYVTDIGFNHSYSGRRMHEIYISIYGRDLLIVEDKINLRTNLIQASSDGAQSNIRFQKSSRVYDASQHYEPMFDSQDVILNDPLPLNGISFYQYKTAGQSQNNFLVPQLIAVDVQKKSLNL